MANIVSVSCLMILFITYADTRSRLSISIILLAYLYLFGSSHLEWQTNSFITRTISYLNFKISRWCDGSWYFFVVSSPFFRNSTITWSYCFQFVIFALFPQIVVVIFSSGTNDGRVLEKTSTDGNFFLIISVFLQINMWYSHALTFGRVLVLHLKLHIVAS